MKRPDDQGERYLDTDEISSLKATLDERMYRKAGKGINQPFFRLRLSQLRRDVDKQNEVIAARAATYGGGLRQVDKDGNETVAPIPGGATGYVVPFIRNLGQNGVEVSSKVDTELLGARRATLKQITQELGNRSNAASRPRNPSRNERPRTGTARWRTTLQSTGSAGRSARRGRGTAGRADAGGGVLRVLRLVTEYCNQAAQCGRGKGATKWQIKQL